MQDDTTGQCAATLLLGLEGLAVARVVRELADSIIEAQRSEIEEMKGYIEDLESR